MPVCGAVPAEIECGGNLPSEFMVLRGFFRPSKRIRHLRCGSESQMMPAGINEPHILFVAPVTPVPATVAELRQSGRICCPEGKIVPDIGIGESEGFLVTGVHVVVPETIRAYGREHLTRKFGLVVSRNRGMQRSVWTAPEAKFAYGLAHEGVDGEAVGIEALPHHHGHVAPPLRPLAVGTVEEGVPHVHVERVESLCPEAGDKLIIAGEAALRLRVVAGPAV